MSNGISARIASGLIVAFAVSACGGGSDGGIGGGGPAPVNATAEFSTTPEALAIVREVAVADAAPEILIFDVLFAFDELDTALNIACSNPGGTAQLVLGTRQVLDFSNCIDLSDGVTTIEGTLNGTIEYEFGTDSQMALEFIDVSYRDFSWDSPVGLFEIDGDVSFESVVNTNNVVETITSDNLVFSNDGFAISIPSLLVVNQFFDDDTDRISFNGALQDISAVNPIFMGLAVYQSEDDLVYDIAADDITAGSFVVFGLDGSTIRVRDSVATNEATYEIDFDGDGVVDASGTWTWFGDILPP